MKNIKFLILSSLIIFLFTSCAGVITLKEPKISGGKAEEKKYVPKKPPVLFEDFEAGTVIGGYSYANTAGGASAKYMISNPDNPEEKAHSGRFCSKAIFNTGTNADWGCGFGSQSVYGSFIDAKDREYISIWVKAPKGIKFYIFCNEAFANGADGEYWNSPDITGTGDWKLYEIPMETFYKNIYSGNQSGNNMVDMTGIGTVGAQIGGAQGEGLLFIDDIYFK
jgi:hypothetical protein